MFEILCMLWWIHHIFKFFYAAIKSTNSDRVDSILYESGWDSCWCPTPQLISTPSSRLGNNFWDQPLNVFCRIPTDNPITADVGQISWVIQLGRTQSSRCFAFFTNMCSDIKSRFWLKGECLCCEISLPP